MARRGTFRWASYCAGRVQCFKAIGANTTSRHHQPENHSGHSPGGTWMATFPKARTCCLSWAESFDSAVQQKITPWRHWGTMLQKLNKCPLNHLSVSHACAFQHLTFFVHMLQILTTPSFKSYPHLKLISIWKMDEQTSFLISDWRLEWQRDYYLQFIWLSE